MDAIMNFLIENAHWMNIVWWVTIVLMIGLFALSIFAPYGKITKILPLTIMFNPRENLNLDIQSVGYAMMHTTWLARISHYTIFIDAFFWFIIFNYFSPILGAVVLMAMTYQASKIGEKAFTLSFLILGVAFYAGSVWMGASMGWSNAWLVAIGVLMSSGMIRFVGHWAEPAPPLMLDDSDKFVKILPKTVNYKLALMPIYGYVAEFSSGLPNRLFTVQVNYLYQLILRLKPTKTLSWKAINERAFKIFRGGYFTDEYMTEYYNLVTEEKKIS